MEKKSENKINFEIAEIAEIRNLIDLILIVRPKTIGIANLMREKLRVFEEGGAIKKSYLKAFRKEIITIVKNIFSKSEFEKLNSMLMGEVEIHKFLEKILNRGKILSDEEFRETMENVDIIIQSSAGMSKDEENLISQINIIAAKYSVNKFSS